MVKNIFKWREFDILEMLPSSWQKDIIKLGADNAKRVILTSSSVTSRETTKSTQIESLVVDGETIKKKTPWLYDLYRGLFREMGQSCLNEELSCAKNPMYAVNLNIQRGINMRYECHVDSNPLQGLLFVTTHPEGTGGELVVCNTTEALGTEQIERDCVRIFPKAGHLLFFDARQHPHFVKPLTQAADERISVAMNFYTPSSPEDARPQDLNSHLFGEN
ncbi:MAG TPA: 2OG-Fe(II) oxygenase [Bacteroidota bacterium]|nr:2OG-Fe(II) oxygenase [Bacteroidota bacterium]